MEKITIDDLTFSRELVENSKYEQTQRVIISNDNSELKIEGILEGFLSGEFCINLYIEDINLDEFKVVDNTSYDYTRPMYTYCGKITQLHGFIVCMSKDGKYIIPLSDKFNTIGFKKLCNCVKLGDYSLSFYDNWSGCLDMHEFILINKEG